MVTNNEDVSNDYASHHKGRSQKKGLKNKVYMSKIECYHCHKMGHYRSDCPDNPGSKKRDREHSNMAEETSSPKKSRIEEELKDLHY